MRKTATIGWWRAACPRRALHVGKPHLETVIGLELHVQALCRIFFESACSFID